MARLTEIINFIKQLRMEVFMLLWALSFSIPSLAGSKLTQDKYCISDLKRDPKLCLNLEELGPEYEDLKDEVLKFSSTMGQYGSYITVFPQIIYALFLGYWLDKHPGHLRYMLALPAVGTTLSGLITLYHTLNFETNTYNLLWAVIPNMFFGGISTMIIGAYAYLGRRVAAEKRSARLGLLALFVMLPMLLARTWGTQLFYQNPMFGLHRNYVGIQMYSMLASLASAFWSLTMLYDAGDPPVDDGASLPEEHKEKSNINMENIENSMNEEYPRSERKGDAPGTNPGLSSDPEPSISFFQSVIGIFTGIGTIFTRERPNNKRTVLAVLILSSLLVNIDSVGEGSVDLQFVQKVYHWDIREYNTPSTVLQGLGAVVTALLPALLINQLKIDEIRIIIGSCISLLFGVIVKGGILEPWAYYVGGIIMLPSGLCRLVLQSVVSRVVEPPELARIFSFMGLADSFGPTLAGTVYTMIFKATISYAPWFYHFVTCILLIVPLTGFLWLDYTKRSWDPIVVRRESRAASLKPNDLGMRFKAGRRKSSEGHVTPISMINNNDAV